MKKRMRNLAAAIRFLCFQIENHQSKIENPHTSQYGFIPAANNKALFTATSISRVL